MCRRALTRAVWLIAFVASACDSTVDGQHPVGGDVPTVAELERYVRRLHLDLAARPPSDDELATQRQQIADANNSVAARRALAEELIATPAWADTYVAELENRFFGGDTIDGQYDFVCFINRDVPPCDLCAPPEPDDVCGNCDCPVLVDLAAERASLSAAAADLAAGATTSSIERRFADTNGFQALLGTPEAVGSSLIEVFLGRIPQAEELVNAAAMIRGALAAGAPAGLLYHRHGSNYADLIDIIFTSEIYREAMVTGAFERYLGRPPSSQELRHFAASIDATNPDLRPVIVAITSSREYFQP
jgi:hypothetical protein